MKSKEFFMNFQKIKNLKIANLVKRIIFTITTLCIIIPTTFAQVNINTADEQELQTLKGVGEVKAKSIIEYREKNGKFQSIDDLKNVDGFGEKTVNKLRDQIVVDAVALPNSANGNKAKKSDNNSKNNADKTKQAEKNKTNEVINNNAISTKK